MSKEFTIALAGSPNSGKTTIFNSITGSRQHVGNYPGVTVEQKTGLKKYKDYLIKLVDLPGTYSLTAYSVEEVVSRDYIINSKPEIILNVVDSSNLERNLYLTTQLIELDTPLVIVFNMSDILMKIKEKVNIKLLSALFGAPIVQTVGNKSKGIEELLGIAAQVFEKTPERKKIIINYGEEIENEIIKIENLLKNNNDLLKKFNLRWLAIKLLEQDKEVISHLKDTLDDKSFYNLNKLFVYSINHIKNVMRDSPEVLIAEARYGFINGALREAIVDKNDNDMPLSDRVDKVIINKILGLPIFIFIMWIMFQVVFKLGNYPVNWLTIGLNKLSGFLNAVIPGSLLKSLLLDGIIGGVGGILVFTPKIMLLFIFITILEDSGYMSRGAFIMDRIMHKIGLHGKSFIPLLIGFGCTIPAYMCGRTLENKSDRLITMHINTFMSCGGRLPIYILFAGIFFPENSGNIIFSLYIIGILMAIAMAKLLRVTRFKGEAEPFVMELPPYRMPTIKGVFIHMWERTWQYIKKAGTIILALSIIMWVLFTFPMIGNKYSQNYNEQLKTLNSSYASGSIAKDTFEKEVLKIEKKMAVEKIEYSAAGRIGHFIEPVFKPLGFDWRLSLASVTGIAGKEVVVSTIGTLFSLVKTQKNNTELNSLIAGTYNPLTGYNFMLFTLLYFPCIASLAVFKKEAGTKEMIFQIFFTLTLAWVVSFIVFQIGRFFI
ncbi:MAG: ferrous iron transport protein B [Actinobacteria bacterium]|nr:ferrous iron transport protein B [Actinomycetota bacterium]